MCGDGSVGLGMASNRALDFTHDSTYSPERDRFGRWYLEILQVALRLPSLLALPSCSLPTNVLIHKDTEILLVHTREILSQIQTVNEEREIIRVNKNNTYSEIGVREKLLR